MMRVAHVINTVEVGGGAGHLLRLTPGLRRLGFDSLVVAGRDGPYAARLREAGISVTILGHMNAADLWSLTRAFLRMRPDLLHLHGSRSGVLGSIASRMAGRVPIIYTAHAFSFKRDLPYPLHAGTILAERLTCRLADRIICLSAEDARAAARLGVAARRMTVIANGIDPAPFNDAQDLRESLAFEPDVPVIGMIGRLVPDKDPVTFVRAAAEVRDRRPRTRFIIVGDGPLREAVEREIQLLRLSRQVTLAGLRDDVPNLLATMDLVVMPSRWEGFPLVVLEAMASARPVICSNIETLAGIVQDGMTGMLVPPGDVAGFADAIVALCTDEGRRMAMGKRAREYVVQAFPVGRMIEQTARVYREALSPPRQVAPAPTTPNS